MSKICPACGCVNENDNARFCNDCGAKFEVNIPEPQARKITLKEVSGNEEVEAKSISEPQKPIPKQEEVSNLDEVPAQPTKVEKQVESAPFEEDDDDDFGEVVIAPVSFGTNDKEDDDDVDDFEQPVFEKPVNVNQTSEPKVTKTAFSSDNLSDDEVTNDPYYDDVLPEIDNEIRAIPRDVIFKVAGAVLVIIAAAFYMLMVWS